MGRSFILKDRLGTAVGYVSQGLGVLRCRLSEARPDMEIVLMYADGTEEKRAIDPSGAEQVWEEEDKEISGAVILAGERIAADTGVEVRRRYDGMTISARRQKQEKAEAVRKRYSGVDGGSTHTAQSRKMPPADEREEGAANGIMEKADTSVFPERRWPPSPCWQTSVYRSGRWMEDEQL